MVSFSNITPTAAFALARAVIRGADPDPETIAAALDVLEASTDPDDRATVAMLRGKAVEPVRADMDAWEDAPAIELPIAPPSPLFAPLAACVLVAVLIGAFIEWSWM